MSFARRNRAIIALVVLLVVGAILAQVAATRNQPNPDSPALDSRDASPTGALALALWLEQLGYRVDRLEGSASSPSDTVRYLFVLRPTSQFNRSDARAVLDWIRRGGTLVYVPSLFSTSLLTTFQPGDGLDRELDLAPTIGAGGTSQSSAMPSLPFFVAPTASRFSTNRTISLQPRDSSWVPLVETGETSRRQVLVARRRYGAGQAVALGSEDFLSNGHLADADNRAVILNVLARGASTRTVAFDEYHHGAVAPPTLVETARSQPWGWVLTYLAVVCLLFALWSGRRFGPPIVREKVPGRSTGDYVTAFAGLLQRNIAKGGASGWAQSQYSRLVRRGLGRTQGVRSDLPAQDLARILAERRPIDAAALSQHLAALGGPPLSDRALLETVRSLEPILRTLEPTDLDAGSRKQPTA